MLASVEIKSRPLRLGMLVDLADKESVSQAITINSTVWGGFYNPLIPIFDRAPRRWTDKPFPSPKARDIVEGYLRAFDPDLLVNCRKGDVLSYLKNSWRIT